MGISWGGSYARPSQRLALRALRRVHESIVSAESSSARTRDGGGRDLGRSPAAEFSPAPSMPPVSSHVGAGDTT